MKHPQWPQPKPGRNQLPAGLVSIFESISDIIVVLDTSWRFLYLNRPALETARKSRDDLLGQIVWEKFPGILGTEVELQCRRAMAEQQPVHFETAKLILRRWYAMHAYPSADGLTVYCRDITDRRRAEEDLRQSEERFKNFMDNSPAVAFMKDEQGKYVYINKVFEERFQTTRKDVYGKNDFEVWPHDIAMAFRQDDQAVLAAGKTLELQEVSPYPDGSKHYWQVFKFPFLDAAGERHVGGMAVDITRQRQIEEELKESAERLQMLSRRLLEVQESERRNLARELHDEVGQMLTGLSLSLEKVRLSLPDELRQSLEGPQALARELSGQMRDLSLRLRPTMLDDLGLLPALFWHLGRYTKQVGIRIDIQQTGLDGRFAPDVETAAYRIVQEALTNIARHANVAEASLRLWCDSNTLHVEIRDRGLGFDLERARAGGKSSGLSGMQERAILLGGQLEIESHPGIGTCVHAKLPICRANEASSDD